MAGPRCGVVGFVGVCGGLWGHGELGMNGCLQTGGWTRWPNRPLPVLCSPTRGGLPQSVLHQVEEGRGKWSSFLRSLKSDGSQMLCEKPVPVPHLQVLPDPAVTARGVDSSPALLLDRAVHLAGAHWGCAEPWAPTRRPCPHRPNATAAQVSEQPSSSPGLCLAHPWCGQGCSSGVSVRCVASAVAGSGHVAPAT